MYYIDHSLANCAQCPLHGRPSAILDTNTPEDLTQADAVFVSINPGGVEIRLDKPFSGRTGLYGRQTLKSILLEYKWVFTNIALCSTIFAGSTQVPTLETVQHCSTNTRRLIRLVQPRIVVLVGQLPTIALLSEQYSSLPMEDLVGQKHSLGPKDVNFLQGFVLYHPRYPMQRKGIHLEKQKWAIERLSTVLRCNHKHGLVKPMSKEQWLTRFTLKPYDLTKGWH